MRHEAEKAVGPRPTDPALSAVRERAATRAPREHSGAPERISELWARFSDVASRNPHAWIQERHTAEEIRTPSATNRPVSFPYPKLMNSNNNVDQAAALILCSVAAAKRFGIAGGPLDLSVGRHRRARSLLRLESRQSAFVAGDPHSPARAVSNSPASVRDRSITSICTVVSRSRSQVAAAELGLDERRPLTVTGGLTFGGGPMNNYVMHSIARMAEVLRGDRNARGLVTANGGYLTKHAFGVYSSQAADARVPA